MRQVHGGEENLEFLISVLDMGKLVPLSGEDKVERLLRSYRQPQVPHLLLSACEPLNTAEECNARSADLVIDFRKEAFHAKQLIGKQVDMTGGEKCERWFLIPVVGDVESMDSPSRYLLHFGMYLARKYRQKMFIYSDGTTLYVIYPRRLGCLSKELGSPEKVTLQTVACEIDSSMRFEFIGYRTACSYMSSIGLTMAGING